MGRNWMRGVLVGWMGLGLLTLPLVALPPTVSITNLFQQGEGTEVRWVASSPELRFTLESRGKLGEEDWIPVPGAVWPSTLQSFRDTQPSATSRYYRVRAEPGPIERGRLIASTEVVTLKREVIQFLFEAAGYPLTAVRDVRVLKLVYETADAHGLRTMASGALALPVGDDRPLPVVSYQHGTALEREDVPSRLNTEGFLGVAFATSGYAAVLPDYLGLGDSPGFHPYHHADSEASSVVDMLRAARIHCGSNGVALGSRLFLAGYSQGAHATLAALRELESRHAAEFSVTACAAGAGAYDLSGTTADDFLSARPQPNPYYFVYLLAAFREVYGIPDYLAEPYATTVPSLLDGRHSGDELNAILPIHPQLVLLPGVRDALAADPDHPIRESLRRNDLIDWTPRAPLRLYHCHSDQDVLPKNAEVARDAFVSRGATVELLDPSPAADHLGCAAPTLLAIKAWFDSLRD